MSSLPVIPEEIPEEALVHELLRVSEENRALSQTVKDLIGELENLRVRTVQAEERVGELEREKARKEEREAGNGIAEVVQKDVDETDEEREENVVNVKVVMEERGTGTEIGAEGLTESRAKELEQSGIIGQLDIEPESDQEQVMDISQSVDVATGVFDDIAGETAAAVTSVVPETGKRENSSSSSSSSSSPLLSSIGEDGDVGDDCLMTHSLTRRRHSVWTGVGVELDDRSSDERSSRSDGSSRDADAGLEVVEEVVEEREQEESEVVNDKREHDDESAVEKDVVEQQGEQVNIGDEIEKDDIPIPASPIVVIDAVSPASPIVVNDESVVASPTKNKSVVTEQTTPSISSTLPSYWPAPSSTTASTTNNPSVPIIQVSDSANDEEPQEERQAQQTQQESQQSKLQQSQLLAIQSLKEELAILRNRQTRLELSLSPARDRSGKNSKSPGEVKTYPLDDGDCEGEGEGSDRLEEQRALTVPKRRPGMGNTRGTGRVMNLTGSRNTSGGNSGGISTGNKSSYSQSSLLSKTLPGRSLGGYLGKDAGETANTSISSSRGPGVSNTGSNRSITPRSKASRNVPKFKTANLPAVFHTSNTNPNTNHTSNQHHLCHGSHRSLSASRRNLSTHNLTPSHGPSSSSFHPQHPQRSSSPVEHFRMFPVGGTGGAATCTVGTAAVSAPWSGFHPSPRLIRKRIKDDGPPNGYEEAIMKMRRAGEVRERERL